MEKVIIIEVLNKLGHVAERFRATSGNITLGRDYSNDVVISDPFVSPKHLKVDASEGTLLVTDLNSHNGTFFDHRNHMINNEVIKSGTVLQVGKTRIRVLTSDHAVADTLRLISHHPMRKVWRSTRGWTMLLIACGLSAVLEYATLAQKFEYKMLIATGITTAIIGLLWAGAWAFAGRLLVHKARFSSHLYATASILCLTTLLGQAPALIEYNTHSILTADITDFLLNFALFSAMLYFNILFATRLSKKVRSWTAGLVSLSIFASAAFLVYVQQNTFNHQQHYSQLLLPPFLKFADAQPADQFLTDAKSVFVITPKDTPDL